MSEDDIIERLVKDDKIIEAGANPKDTTKKNEEVKFGAFKRLAKEKLNTTVNLFELAGSGIAKRKDAEAKKALAETQKILEEAGQIAAQKESDAEAARIDSSEKLNRLIDDIFKEEQDPNAQMMKLANLFSRHPELAAALGEFEEYFKELSYRTNCVISFSDKTAALEEGSETAESSES